MTDRKLDAVTEALRSLPLEQRAPGYGYDEIPGKADLLEFLERDEGNQTWTCICDCDCPAPGQPDDDGTPGWCDPCRMNIHQERSDRLAAKEDDR